MRHLPKNNCAHWGDFMKSVKSILIYGASILASAASMAGPAAAAQPAAHELSTLDEVVVTARRQAERLQDVPQTVFALPAETLSDLQVRKLQDIDQVVPGLTLSPGSFGQVQMRGVATNTGAGGDSTIAFYLNDVDFAPGALLQGMFDVGQIEVLRGPQGTNRGVSAPSGAITIRTRQPDLSEYGGYVDGSLTNQHGRNVEGGVSIPIVKDKFGVRLAAMHQEDEGTGVNSIHSGVRPKNQYDAARISLRLTPNDAFEMNVMYQHLERRQKSFTQVLGVGDGNAINPPIEAGDRLAVTDNPARDHNFFDTVTATADLRLWDHKLSYVGGYNHSKNKSQSPTDTGNVLPGHDTYTLLAPTGGWQTSHEIRISSEPAAEKFFDYTAGVYFREYHQTGIAHFSGQYLPGAFGGALASPNIAAFNPRYFLDVKVGIPYLYREVALFGEATVHVTPNTDITAGIRKIDAIFKGAATLDTTPAFAAFPAALVGGNCALAGAIPSPVYPGLCDRPVPAQNAGRLNARDTDNPTLYSVAASHKFTPNFMLYGNIGTSYLRPTSSIGIQGGLATSTNPELGALTFHPAQRSTGYEIGFKSTFLENRARLNVAVFRQKFRDYQINQVAQYFNTATNQVVNQFTFYPSVDATIRGIDVDASFNVTPEWNISLLGAYATGKAKGTIPCDTFNAAGQPTFNTDGLISLCEGTAVPSRAPKWNTALMTSYERPLSDDLDGFVRAQWNYYPKNKRQGDTYDVDSYSIVNLFAGVRSPDGAWEVTAFVKNLFKDDTLLGRSERVLQTSGLASFPTLNRPSNYYSAQVVQQREIGVGARYAFGSR